MKTIIATLLLSLALPAGAITQVRYQGIAGAPANVKDFGAKCTGNPADAAADTAGIQAAVTAAAEVYIPPGTCIVNAQILLPPNRDIKIFGSGGGSIINRATAGNIFYRNSRGDLTEIDGIIFTGSAVAYYHDGPDPGGGVERQQRHEFRIRNCRFFQDATTYAIYLNRAREGSIDNCFFQNNQGIGRFTHTINTDVIGCHFKDTVYCIRTDGSEGLKVIGGTALGSQYGAYSTNEAGVQIVGVMWDYMDNPVIIAGDVDVSITGSYMSTRTANPVIWVGESAQISKSQNVHIVGNLLSTNGDDVGDGNLVVRLQNVDYYDVGSNSLTNWKLNGLEYSACTNGSIHDNSIIPRATFGTNAIATGSDSATVTLRDNVMGKPALVSLAPIHLSGFGSPAGAVAAPPGSTYINTTGGGATTLWVKESGAGTSGWAGK